MVKRKIDELAAMMGKSRFEVEEMLKKDDVIELNLSERSTRNKAPKENFRILE